MAIGAISQSLGRTRIAAAVLFWIAVSLIERLDWNLGVYKALVMAAVLGALPIAIRAARHRARAADGASPLLVVGVSALLLLQSGYAARELRHPALIDVATTTLAATSVLAEGANPYAARLDASGTAQLGDARFSGYKYLPLTLATFGPLGAMLGERGIVLTNLLLHLATVWLLFGLACDLAGTAAGWAAAMLYLSLPIVPFQLFTEGVIDAVAVVPLLAALRLVERNAAAAGFCVGLSLSAKLLPGAPLLLCCFPAAPRERRVYALGVAAGLLPILPFLAADPRALLNNTVIFNFVRPPDSTSWLFFAPPILTPLAHVALAVLFLASLVGIWRHPPTLVLRCGLAAILILATLLAGPIAHNNYQLWWLPLATAVLGAALFPQAGSFASTRAAAGV